MNQRTIAKLTAELIIRYYANDTAPFLNHFDDDSLWYGPAEGQFIKGRKAMLRIWKKEKHDLTFTVGNIKVETISSSPSSCNVMLSYPVTTHYPDGQDISLHQRLLLCWGERIITDERGKRKKQPRILVCHISNPHPKHSDDVVYPVHFEQIYEEKRFIPQMGERIHFHGVDRTDYFYLSDNIIWIETAAGGMHSILHTTHETTEVLDKIINIEKKHPHSFLRCHQSYLVNPNYIRNVHRFQVTLINGVTLPIPEKKYTAFKEQVTNFFEKDLSQLD